MQTDTPNFIIWRIYKQMNEIKELIDKLWSKKITSAEQRKLSEFINKEPLKLQAIMKEDFEKEILSPQEEVTTPRFQNILKILHTRMDECEPHSQLKILPLYHWLKLVAALIVVSLGVLLYLNWNSSGPVRRLATNHSKIRTEILHQPFNSGKTAMIINLSDGSVVTLQPGSSLSYYQPFDSKSRNISMNGEATFKVAKDKLHPFMVKAKGFTTTALGTEFTINTDKEDYISVKLMEGKVVVRSNTESAMRLKDVYLVPGQQLSINTRLKKENVIEFENIKNINKPHLIFKTLLKEAITFNEAPLNTVFSQLAKHYNIHIGYSGIEEAELQKLYFTGTFSASEKLEVLLPVICNMNELTFKRNANSIIISKQK